MTNSDVYWNGLSVKLFDFLARFKLYTSGKKITTLIQVEKIVSQKYESV